MDEGVLDAARRFAQRRFAGDCGGHDFQHTLRVSRLSVRLARAEGADAGIAELSALLHDVDDRKLSPGTHAGLDNARAFLRLQALEESVVARVCAIIRDVPFSEGRVPETLEGKIVQDADRLDAIGAIGIARAFAYGGSRGRALYDPDEPPALSLSPAEYRLRASTTVNHFYEKLLRLKDQMNTPSGRRIALSRHRYMEAFLRRFLDEWDGRR